MITFTLVLNIQINDQVQNIAEYSLETGLTDDGACWIFNGEAFKATYKAGDKVDQLAKVLDARGSAFKPKKINGTGVISEITFLLNLADRWVHKALHLELNAKPLK